VFGVLNSAIFNSFHNRVEFGTILEGLRNFGVGGVVPPKRPSVRPCLVLFTTISVNTSDAALSHTPVNTAHTPARSPVNFQGKILRKKKRAQQSATSIRAKKKTVALINIYFRTNKSTYN